uniref:Uncharacterized protein n=1 Tax=Aegilops tauschii subsp. strangulata TaxID=200361 RepID=A0A453IL86_AEGTS
GLARKGREEGEGNTVASPNSYCTEKVTRLSTTVDVRQIILRPSINHSLTFSSLRRLQIPGRSVLVLPLPLVSPLIKAPENNFPLPNPPDIAPLPHPSKLSRAREASALLDPPFAWTFDPPRISHHFGFIGHLWRQLGIGLAGMRLHGDVSDDEEEGAVMDP